MDSAWLVAATGLVSALVGGGVVPLYQTITSRPPHEDVDGVSAGVLLSTIKALGEEDARLRKMISELEVEKHQLYNKLILLQEEAAKVPHLKARVNELVHESRFREQLVSSLQEQLAELEN